MLGVVDREGNLLYSIMRLLTYYLPLIRRSWSANCCPLNRLVDQEGNTVCLGRASVSRPGTPLVVHQNVSSDLLFTTHSAFQVDHGNFIVERAAGLVDQEGKTACLRRGRPGTYLLDSSMRHLTHYSPLIARSWLTIHYYTL